MKTILIIDDKLSIVENLVEFFELRGFKVISTNNGVDGVQLAKKHLPDLIVCDILMPCMDGYEVLETLLDKPETHNIPFIYSTAKAESFDRDKAMSSGAQGYLVKPYDPVDLLNLVNSLIDTRGTC